MKKLFVYYAVIISIVGLTGTLYAQRTADLFIENSSIAGGYFYFEIHITPTNDWGTLNRKALGDCSWYFSYNSSALSNPTLSYVNSTYVGTADGYTNTVGIYGGKVGVTTDLDTDTYDGVNIPTDQKTHIYTVRLQIDNASAESDLFWDQINTGIFNAQDNEITESYNGNGDMSLPVQMISFSATANPKQGVVLTWETQSETNCAGFHVLRSLSEEDPYQTITTAMIPGHGNSSSMHEYQFADRNVENGKTYWYKIVEVSMDGKEETHGPISVLAVSPIPTKFALSQNYPNPFNPETTFDYQLPEDTDVLICIYNTLGKRVKTIVDKHQEAGYYTETWRGLNEEGRKASSGIYLLNIETKEFHSVKKISLVR